MFLCSAYLNHDSCPNNRLSPNTPGKSARASFVVGNLQLSSPDFAAKKAGEEGVAIASVCAPSSVKFVSVYYERNAPYCPPGQYDLYNIDEVEYNYHEVRSHAFTLKSNFRVKSRCRRDVPDCGHYSPDTV